MAYTTVISILFFSVVHAANDWSKPCLSGVCQYDLPSSTNGGSSGTVKIWGSQNAISDITTAARWEIIGCSPNTTSQTVRIVCKDDETTSKECAHLFSNLGPEGKIVRLPENCGKSAFARVAKSSIPADQSIPSSISRRIVRRNGAQPQVKALTLDTNFSAVDTSKFGNVNFVLRGATIPGANGDISIPQVQSRAHGMVNQRGLFSGIGNLLNPITSLNDWNTSSLGNTSKTIPFDVTKSTQIFNKDISCPPLTAGAKVNVNVDTHGTANIGIAASGTILPPKVEDFAITASLSADLGGSINLNANVGGSLDSGKIQIFEIGIPGLDFPGILTIGPSFQVNAELTATLDVEANLTVGVNYQITNANFDFPSKAGSSTGGSFKPADTPLQLSLASSVKATASLEAHIIPSINIGINALDGVVNSGIFLDLDTSAKASLTVEAGAQANVTSSAVSSSHAARTSVSVCFDVTAGLSVNVGATASFFGLFDPSTTITLFNKQFDLFQVRSSSFLSFRRFFSFSWMEADRHVEMFRRRR
ncbi:hypothetical protein BDQ17DRAFT_1257644 [Cyathus striatus]|nr:hypothetical protein BDQ17DRAFT_1257644 [Cyathus striatus]